MAKAIELYLQYTTKIGLFLLLFRIIPWNVNTWASWSNEIDFWQNFQGILRGANHTCARGNGKWFRFYSSSENFLRKWNKIDSTLQKTDADQSLLYRFGIWNQNNRSTSICIATIHRLLMPLITETGHCLVVYQYVVVFVFHAWCCDYRCTRHFCNFTHVL